MRHLLAMDTATEICGVALMVNEQVAAQTVFSHGSSHARRLMAAVDWILGCAGVSVDLIDAFAVTSGPGSFTGLRIGLSTAKGLAAALQKPLVGVSSLEVLAHQSPPGSRWVCPVIDARRGEVYWALYERRGADLVSLIGPGVGPAAEIHARIQVESKAADCFFIGNGARLYAEVIERTCRDGRHPAADHLNDLNPAVLARIGYRKWRSGQYDAGLGLAPLYIRQSDARAAAV